MKISNKNLWNSQKEYQIYQSYLFHRSDFYEGCPSLNFTIYNNDIFVWVTLVLHYKIKR